MFQAMCPPRLTDVVITSAASSNKTYAAAWEGIRTHRRAIKPHLEATTKIIPQTSSVCKTDSLKIDNAP